ncbi:DUF2141 domain-containing protein [Sphingomonas xanthus]|uniref:DUF2141 domain-containing protein n=1 Tax=Sphingomonas xanthus TaxID=2594473 RepID=A0A516IPP1_9SPHN|nr:DUF2141 domain-containing protein [Sphingomonas xanthus]QDP18714.1 DUF2141 domain-containing protein [Sphingomonas xanthus]
MRTILPLAFLLLIAADDPTATIEINVEGLRNGKGQLHLCLTRNPVHFPNCIKDPSALRRTVPTAEHQFRLTGVAPGRYAVTLVHDENSNARLDMFMGIPREGFGFSRNPTIRFGAPKFESVDIDLAPGFTRASVRMQYLL